jgi:hypothetical protein
MADTTKPALTVDQVRSAAKFGPELCAPVATLIHGFHGDLPAENVLILTSQLSAGGSYFAAKSPELEYWMRSLTLFKETLQKTVRPDFFSRHYDPAIAFFRTELQRGGAVKIDCRRHLFDTASPAAIPFNQKGIASADIKRHLESRFGFAVEGTLEEWLGHRVFYGDLRRGADLVIVIPEIHYAAAAGRDTMLLLDRLLERKGSIDIVSAHELAPDETAFGDDFRDSDIYTALFTMREEGDGAVKMFRWFTSDPARMKALCGGYRGANLAFCLNTAVIPEIQRIIWGMLTGMGPDTAWGLEEPRVRRKSLEVASKMLEKMGDAKRPPEEVHVLSNSARELFVKRSIAMAETLAAKLRQKRRKRTPRIIVLPTGAFHALDIIRHLRKKSDASIIGLMPNHFVEVLTPIAKVPK